MNRACSCIITTLLVFSCSRNNPYDPKADNYIGKDAWEEVGPVPNARSKEGIVSLNNKLYVVGGYDWYTSRPVRAVDRYDPVLNQWETLDSLQVPRHSFAIGVANDKIYVFGGYSVNTWGWEVATSSVEEYDPSTGIWSSKREQSLNFIGCKTATVDDEIYILGDTSSVFCYKPLIDSITAVAPAHTQYCDHLLNSYELAFEYNGKVYALFNDFYRSRTSLLEFQTTSLSWGDATLLDVSDEWAPCTAGLVETKVYILSGQFNNGTQVDEFSLSDQKLTRKASLEYDGDIVACMNTAYIVGSSLVVFHSY